MTEEELAEFLNHPSRWPYRPMLPMKLHHHYGILTGYMVEGRGLTVFDYDSGEPQEGYASIEELYEAGWRID